MTKFCCLVVHITVEKWSSVTEAVMIYCLERLDVKSVGMETIDPLPSGNKQRLVDEEKQQHWYISSCFVLFCTPCRKN